MESLEIGREGKLTLGKQPQKLGPSQEDENEHF